MHISILLWGLTAVLGKAIQLDGILLVWYRMMIVAASLFVYIRFTGRSFSVSRKNFKQLSFVGVLLMLHWLCFYGAVKNSNVSITLSVFSSTTLFTALIEPLITKKRFNKMELLYSFMAMAGIGLIFYSDENLYTKGIILALLAAFIGAFFNILNKGIVSELESGVVSLYEILMGLLALTIYVPLHIYLMQPQTTQAHIFPTTTDWVLLAVLAILCTHVTLILSLNALRHLDAFTLNLAINLEPIYGIALAFLIFKENEHLNKWFFAGTAIIMLSVVLHSYFEGRARNQS
ncbi:MAG: DMT family transporter [Chitinophagales bacterium]